MFDEICLINEAVRRWLWGIHLLQRLRVPLGCPRLPRMPVVMLLQLGAPTLCLRKRTPQSHLLCVGCLTYFLVSYRPAYLDFFGMFYESAVWQVEYNYMNQYT